MNKFHAKLLLAAAITLALGSAQVVADDKTAAKAKSGPVVDARQEAQIWTTYTLSPYLRANDLTVTVLDGKATLSGNVEDDVHKDLAGAIAAGVNGISDVDNKITVDADYKAPDRSSTRGYGDVVDDATITTAIKSKLLWSKHTEGMDTKVVTNAGKVELSGTVATQQAKQQAEKLAKNTDGVRSVDNKLQVSDKTADGKIYKKADAEKGSVIADSWITTKVKSTFMYSSNVAGSDISVKTDKGVVTLAGEVGSGAEQALAIELAQNIRGVKSVTSRQLVF
ncbi:Osmotically-inducible protein OsmY, contains BON domain [Rheinheimera pacifica]|uniref:Osmotically-inducible protein OsmY, contains BON domain n=1 Tax=Rheinheimera pacifica TaxID=173990 RepID=A0A1H6N489_9GAMM|nr:BON domain-containing protein [Rheinheimera pacifica]SEI04996.1 Osmotically-inducible protein OsmY, contains BON domain [Rheinheimera pacifica]